MPLRVKATVFLMILSTTVYLGSATARGASFIKRDNRLMLHVVWFEDYECSKNYASATKNALNMADSISLQLPTVTLTWLLCFAFKNRSSCLSRRWCLPTFKTRTWEIFHEIHQKIFTKSYMNFISIWRKRISRRNQLSYAQTNCRLVRVDT